MFDIRQRLRIHDIWTSDQCGLDEILGAVSIKMSGHQFNCANQTLMWNDHRTVYPVNDPRAVLYGTPRKETLLKLAEGAPAGCFVEFGVYQGGSAWRLAKLAKCQGRSCHLFDTFSGIPEQSEIDFIPIGHLGDVDLAEVRRLIPTGVFHVGVFPATMPDEFEPIAFAHIDCDQYQSLSRSD